MSWSRVSLRETDPYPNDARFSLKSGRFQPRDEKASARFPVLLLEVSRKDIVAESEKKTERESPDIHRTGLKRRKFPT